MQEAANVLSVNHLKISFPGQEEFVAVNDITFHIEKGKTLAIVGESGSGKSLTALALMGLLPSSARQQGDMLLLADNPVKLIASANWQAIRGKDIGMIFQEPMSALNPIMRIGKQLTECITAHQKLPYNAARQLTMEWLHKVQLPDPAKLYGRFPHQLSGGQKQRVMIAMAMCNNPRLLVADEPTTALDVTIQQEIMQLMRLLQQQHSTAMLFITHDLALAAAIADDVLVMYRGDALEYGRTSEVLHTPRHPYTKALLASKPAAGQKNHRLPVVADFLAAGQSQTVLNVLEQPKYPHNVSDRDLLRVKNLRVWFTDNKDILGRPVTYFKAIDNVSFTLHEGEVLGLAGESGCGKSTLSRSLMGLLPIHDGQILLEGADIAAFSPRQWKNARTRMQMIFQDPVASLNPRMTIGSMLMEPLHVHSIVPRSRLRKEAVRLLDMVHLPANSLNRYPHQFSGGQRQRISIARALALRPRLLICDESVSALDVSVQAQILNLLKELQQQFRLSYLFISHDLSVVHYISDRVMIMQQGKIVETGNADDVLKHPVQAYTQRLIAAMPVLAK